jgi:four helix bundle protein
MNNRERIMKSSVVHTKGLHIVRETARLSSMWPSEFSYLSDQVRRASSSIVLNFGEGSGRSSRKDRERFFAMARGSAREAQACIDVAHALGLVDDARHRELVEACVHVSLALRRFGAR